MSNAGVSRGLLKLMLRLPAFRSELQVIFARDDGLRDLCDAYDEATQVLSWMRANPNADPAIVADYENVCSGIESEVVELCSASGSAVQ